MKPKYLFGDMVVVEHNLIGVVLKTWINDSKSEVSYEVYIRFYNAIHNYEERDIKRYRVRHKELNEEELEYQNY